jgi:hypothetical protein
MIELLCVICKSNLRLQIDGEYYDVGPISDNFILSVSFKPSHSAHSLLERKKNMDAKQRKLAIVTSLGKKYSGMVDVPSENFRTTDLLNSSNIFWKSPNLKCYDSAIFMSDVRLFLDGTAIYKKFDFIQIKISDIIYFYDDIEGIGDEMEKKRASTMVRQTNEDAQTVNIITKQVANSFYDITGRFFGLFKKKSKDNFVPLTQANIVEICRRQDKWVQKKVKLPHNFICVSNNHIESVTFL